MPSTPFSMFKASIRPDFLPLGRSTWVTSPVTITLDPKPILDALDFGVIPVLTPLATDFHGQPYNINADIAACEVAKALHSEKLVFLSDVPGVLRDPSLYTTDASCAEVEPTKDMEKEEFWKKFCDFCESDLWPIAEKLMKECSDFKKLIDNKILEQYLDNLSTITLYNMPHMRGSVREILKKPNFTMDEIKKEIENFKNPYISLESFLYWRYSTIAKS